MSMFVLAKAKADSLHSAAKDASDALNEFRDRYPRGPMGLTPDHVKAMPEFKALNSAYQRAAAASRAFNAVYTKQFSKEIRAERKERMRKLMEALAS